MRCSDLSGGWSETRTWTSNTSPRMRRLEWRKGSLFGGSQLDVCFARERDSPLTWFGLFCSGRIAIPCGGWARTFMGKFMPVAGGRDAYTIRLGGVCPVVGRVFRMKCLPFLRRASGGSLLAFGLLLVWSEQVGVGVGSDPGGTASHLAQISLSVVIWVGRFEHHTARSDTPCRKKTRHGRSCSLLMCAVCWCGAVLWFVSCQSRLWLWLCWHFG